MKEESKKMKESRLCCPCEGTEQVQHGSVHSSSKFLSIIIMCTKHCFCIGYC